jgi:hypothetical protein
MADPVDYSTLSDEELDKIISGGRSAGTSAGADTARAATAAKAVALEPPATAEQIEPSPWKRGAAALGGAALEPIMGAWEKLQLAFPGEGVAGDATRAGIAADRTQRRGALEQLKQTPAGQFGAFAGEVLPYVNPLAPTTVPAQMGIASGIGFLRGGPDKPKDLVNELSTSGVNAVVEGATTGAVAKGAQYLGKAANAARGNYSAEGQALMSADEAAQRLGLTGDLRPGIGQLDPNSKAGIIERGLPSYAKRVEQQASRIADELSTTRQTPGVTPGTTVDQNVPGGVLKDELTAAIRERMSQANAKYDAVDTFAAANNVAPISPIFSVPNLSRLHRNVVKGDEASQLALRMVQNYDDEALKWYGNSVANGMNQQQIKAAGISTKEYHNTRVAVNKAFSTLQRVNPANKTDIQSRAEDILKKLRDSLDDEAETWAKRNAGQREVMDAYNEAKQFYRETVAPAILENPYARKVTTKRTPWPGARDMYAATISPKNEELVDRLLPTMGSMGQDIVRTLRGLPDVASTLATGKVPSVTSQPGILDIGKAAVSAPLSAIAELAPVGALSRSTAAKRLYSAEDMLKHPGLGRALAAGAQYAQDPVAPRTRRLLGQQR